MRPMERVFRAVPILVLAVLAGCERGSPGADPDGHEEAEDRTVVQLSSTQLEAAGIETERIALRTITETIEAAAAVEVAADGVARLGSRVAGRVVEVPVIEGDTVRAGSVVAVVDSPDLGRAKADYLAALASADVAREIAEREAGLFRDRITSEQDFRRAQADATRADADREAAENRLHALGLTDDDLVELASERHYTSRLDIRTPIGGVVVDRDAALGEMIEPTHVLVTVMDLREVWVLVEVFDQQLARIREGQRVVARTRAYPEREFEGHIDNVGSILDPTTRAVPVRVVIPNPDGALKPGMFADVEIHVDREDRRPVLAIPGTAVQRDDGELVVFVRTGPTSFERRVVTLDGAPETWAVISSGVEEGEEVAVSGAFVLKSELGKGELGEHGH